MALTLCKLAVVIILLKSSEVLGQEKSQTAKSSARSSCGETNCKINPCKGPKSSCCWCELADYAALQVCQCCPEGTFCCPYTPSPLATNSPVCCPRGSQCAPGGCIIDEIKARQSETVCSQCGSLSPSSSSSDPLQISITADNVIEELYVDGEDQMPGMVNAADWTKVDTISVPADSRVIAVKCTDQGSQAGLLASAPDDYLITDANWKCTTSAPAGWELPEFDDASWPAAVEYKPNTAGVSPYGYRPPISGNAKWIWTPNSADNIVYCRGYFPENGDGSCSDLCAQQDKVRCGCEMMQTGPSKICSCCPKGYQCCDGPLSSSLPQSPPTCCPVGYQCSEDGSSCGTTPVLVTASEAEIDCGPCNKRSDKSDSKDNTKEDTDVSGTASEPLP